MLAYPFVWLDEVVEITLNPEASPVAELTIAQLSALRVQLVLVFRQVLLLLKTRMFGLTDQLSLHAVAAHYDQAINLLQTQAARNNSQYAPGGGLAGLGAALYLGLDTLRKQLNQRYATYLPERGSAVTAGTPPAAELPAARPDKIVCRLSVDQLGILLKAADDSKLLVSRSLSLVFKSLVPYLATEKKEDISWDSMRSSTYHMEERDRQIAIERLEKMIRLIRQYR